MRQGDAVTENRIDNDLDNDRRCHSQRDLGGQLHILHAANGTFDDAGSWQFFAAVHAGIQSFGLVDRRTAGFGSHRHVLDNFAVLDDGDDVCFYPVIIAIFGAILDNAMPGFSSFYGTPQIGKCGGRHIRGADNIVALADQLTLGEATELNKIFITVSKNTFEVRPGDQNRTLFHLYFVLCYWLVISHRSRPALVLGLMLSMLLYLF